MTGSKYKAPLQRPIFGSTLHVESVERLSSLMACLRTLNVQRATHSVHQFRASMSAYFKPPKGGTLTRKSHRLTSPRHPKLHSVEISGLALR